MCRELDLAHLRRIAERFRDGASDDVAFVDAFDVETVLTIIGRLETAERDRLELLAANVNLTMAAVNSLHQP